MKYVSISYAIKYVISFSPNYGWTVNDECINIKTNRIIKQVYKNRSIGYCIDRKFYSLTLLRKHLIKPNKNICPF